MDILRTQTSLEPVKSVHSVAGRTVQFEFSLPADALREELRHVGYLGCWLVLSAAGSQAIYKHVIQPETGLAAGGNGCDAGTTCLLNTL